MRNATDTHRGNEAQQHQKRMTLFNQQSCRSKNKVYRKREVTRDKMTKGGRKQSRRGCIAHRARVQASIDAYHYAKGACSNIWIKELPTPFMGIAWT